MMRGLETLVFFVVHRPNTLALLNTYIQYKEVYSTRGNQHPFHNLLQVF